MIIFLSSWLGCWFRCRFSRTLSIATSKVRYNLVFDIPSNPCKWCIPIHSVLFRAPCMRCSSRSSVRLGSCNSTWSFIVIDQIVVWSTRKLCRPRIAKSYRICSVNVSLSNSNINLHLNRIMKLTHPLGQKASFPTLHAQRS